MVLLWIGVAVGILIATILIIKAVKTNSREILGIENFCKKCGTQTNGLDCPKCERKSKSFGV
ncbi:hypothetical protein AAA799E16_01542 [Marine Group I thaumarchaeote SCGC AAA799-E16]|uniref:Uncharacterized protein n=2 Tax=Marine Group I TaxID=905826 RepID=A0A087RSV6_9ARCH|nr:hypothetical protein AAA799E16_01542 [Marine Group I thaumarchaeote SCGC AAA799-E16]KFM16560.1 hypothetical protein SCCGRSA3_02208 [Marine Group I thaumarchaeote SCGC RSA3]